MLCFHVRAGQQSLDARGDVEAARRPLALPRLDTAPSRALHSLLDQLRSERRAYMSLRIARRCVCSLKTSSMQPWHLIVYICPLPDSCSQSAQDGGESSLAVGIKAGGHLIEV